MPRKYVLLLTVSLAVVALDQATKYWVLAELTTAFDRAPGFGDRLSVMYSSAPPEGIDGNHYRRKPAVVLSPSFFALRYAENPGAAWGMLRDLPAGFRHGFFVVMTLAALTFILWYFRKLRDDQRWMQVALSFVFSGAVGNLIDRLARGYVIDFVQWHWWKRPDLYWPIFNLADSLIVVGVAMILLHPDPKRARSR